MTRYVWNNRLKQRIRFSYWNELCVTGCAEAPVPVLTMDIRTQLGDALATGRQVHRDWPAAVQRRRKCRTRV
ncbi:Uncharacterised protein [Serratia plymuthica]|nr:Uncharacterised protein [Serratia plymuthica]